MMEVKTPAGRETGGKRIGKKKELRGKTIMEKGHGVIGEAHAKAFLFLFSFFIDLNNRNLLSHSSAG